MLGRVLSGYRAGQNVQGIVRRFLPPLCPGIQHCSKMAIVDDKSEHVIPFLLKRVEQHQKEHGESSKPFFLGLNGVQGAGKTTLVSQRL